METLPRVQTGIRTGLAALVLVASGCTAEAQDGPATTATWETAPTAVELDFCALNSDQEVIQPFDGQKFLPNESETTIYDVARAMFEKYPDAKPQEFANLYLESRRKELGANHIQIVLDPSVGLTGWEPVEGQFAEAERQGQRTGLLRDLSDIIDVVDDYPTGMLSALNVKTIRLADTHELESIAAHYDTGHDEIQVEYNTKEEVRLRGNLKEVIAHEIGHAIHDYWCGGYDFEDAGLAGSIEFIGYLEEEISEDEQQAIYEKVKNIQYSDGPTRIFPNAYGATSVQEYFASIIAFTLESRGLIQPGDKDYDSPLYHNQRLVVSRIESLFPGFEDFVKKQTVILRTSPKNEIYEDLERLTVSNKEIEQLLAATPEGESLVINGAYVDEHLSGRGGAISLFPKAYKDLQGLKLSLEVWESGGGTYVDLEVQDYTNQIYILRMPGSESLLVPQGQLDAVYLNYDIKPRTELWAGEPAAAAYIKAMQAKGAKLVLVEFTK